MLLIGAKYALSPALYLSKLLQSSIVANISTIPPTIKPLNRGSLYLCGLFNDVRTLLK